VSLRADTLEAFAELTKIEDINRVVQRGRDPQTARYTFEFTDGREIRIGTINTLWSQTELGKVFAVTIGQVILPCKPNDWRTAIAALIAHATDVIETPDETYEATVLDWLKRYAAHATTDRDGAATNGAPYIDDARLHVSASDLARYVRREYSEQVKLHELRQALADLGFERVTIHYVRGTTDNPVRSSTSYYQAPLTAIRGTEDQA
jgi:hypothetical protein